MKETTVLIVDDEENIRLTLSQALASLPVQVETASDGVEALAKAENGDFAVILLDLRMPRMDGLQVLEQLSERRPEIPVIVLTAHGTIDSAVEATKLGAIEFLQKPFVPVDVRRLVNRVLDRGKLVESESTDYATHFELAKKCITERHADAAIEHLKKAISISPERPEAYNLMGAIHELRGEMHEALNNYRAAWHFDATYEPCQRNLERATTTQRGSEPISFGELRE